MAPALLNPATQRFSTESPIVDVEVLPPAAMPATMIDHWRALQAADEELDSPFLSPDWVRAVDRAQGRFGRGMSVAVLRQGGRARGYLAARVGAGAAMEAGAPLCDYQAVVAEDGVRLDPRVLVRALGVGRLDFSHMLACQDAFAPWTHGRATSWIVELPDGYEAYAAGRREAGVAALKAMDKKRRKLERERGPIVFTAHSRSAADFEQLFAWKRSQLRATNQVDIFAPAWPMRLMRDLFLGGDEGFGGVLFTLRVGGVLAAAHFHLRGARTLHAWMIAHCAELERYSPGLLLFQDILRWMDDTPLRRLDLGKGDYRFKRELANARREVSHGFVGIPSPSAFVRGAAYGVRKAAETLPLGPMSALPGKAMRRLDIMRGLSLKA